MTDIVNPAPVQATVPAVAQSKTKAAHTAILDLLENKMHSAIAEIEEDVAKKMAQAKTKASEMIASIKSSL